MAIFERGSDPDSAVFHPFNKGETYVARKDFSRGGQSFRRGERLAFVSSSYSRYDDAIFYEFSNEQKTISWFILLGESSTLWKVYFASSASEDQTVELSEKVEDLLSDFPEKQFCLHNGFAGFSYGSPLNPKFLDNQEAVEILGRIEELLGVDPVERIRIPEEQGTLVFENGLSVLAAETGFRMLGFNARSDCIFERTDKA